MSKESKYSKEIGEILKKHLIPNHMSNEFFEHKREGVISIVDAIKLAIYEILWNIDIEKLCDENVSLFAENTDLKNELNKLKQ